MAEHDLGENSAATTMERVAPVHTVYWLQRGGMNVDICVDYLLIGATGRVLWRDRDSSICLLSV